MDEIEVKVIFDGATSDPARLRTILTKLCELEPYAPSYRGRSEQKRESWDIDTVLSFVAADKARYSKFLSSSITIWRTSQPRYQGAVSATDQTVNRLTLRFSPGPASKHLQAIFEAAEELVRSVPMILAYVHPMWKKGAEALGSTERDVSRYTWGREADEHSMRVEGLLAVNARTWFGPWLAERIGRDRLLAVEGSSEGPAGAVRIDLSPEPPSFVRSSMASVGTAPRWRGPYPTRAWSFDASFRRSRSTTIVRGDSPARRRSSAPTGRASDARLISCRSAFPSQTILGM